MKTKYAWIEACLAAALLMLPTVAHSQFLFATNSDGTLTITGTGGGFLNGAVDIPSQIYFATYPTKVYRTITGIGQSAFAGNNQMTSVTIAGSITNIGDYAFSRCYSMTSISVNVTNPAYSSETGILFNKNQTTLIQWPTAKAGSYVIPNNVKNIGNGAFESCSLLTSITIPSGVTAIDDHAFLGCASLTNISIPDTVTNIGDLALAACKDLTAIVVDTNNQSYSDVGGVLFDKSQATLISFPAGFVGNYTMPNGVTNIIYDAFALCPGLTNITIADSVANIGDSAFQYCRSLSSVTIPDSVTSMGNWMFYGCVNLTNATIGNGLANIPDFTFYELDNLASATIGNSVTNIGYDAFGYCRDLTSITFGNSVTSIGDYAFPGCTGLTSISIPESVTSIGEYAFPGCTGLTNITIPNSVTNIGRQAFMACSNLIGVYFEGNTPAYGQTPFYQDNQTIVYYLPGTKGWNASYGGLPTVLWNPQAQTGDASFGVQNNKFGFTIAGSSNLVIVVEASTNLSNPAWIPVGTNTLNTFIGTNGTSYFSDPLWAIYTNRFYRFRSP